MKAVDDVIAAVAASGIECRAIEQAVALPKTHEMSPRGGCNRLMSSGLRPLGWIKWADW